MKALLFAVVIICFLSCRKEEMNCLEIVEGAYFGVCTTADTVMEGTLTISPFPSNLGDVFPLVAISDNIAYNGIYVGQLSSDCSLITIAFTSTSSSSDSISVTGFLTIDDSKITGNVHYHKDGVVQDCSYALMKFQ